MILGGPVEPLVKKVHVLQLFSGEEDAVSAQPLEALNFVVNRVCPILHNHHLVVVVLLYELLEQVEDALDVLAQVLVQITQFSLHPLFCD